MSEYWTYINKDSDIIKRYFRHILTSYDISAGIFNKSDPSYPVSWALYSDFGHAMGLHTLPEHRHMGFGILLVSNVAKQLLQKGIVPVGEVFQDSFLDGKFGKYIIDTTWRDSITGECYW